MHACALLYCQITKGETRGILEHCSCLKKLRLSSHICAWAEHLLSLKYYLQFWFKMGPLLKIKPVYLTLPLCMCETDGKDVTYHWWLLQLYIFSSCTLSIMQEPLGKQELLVNQSLMWKPQRPRQQNCFSLILHVFELRNQSLWMRLLGKPCCLPASEEKGE